MSAGSRRKNLAVATLMNPSTMTDADMSLANYKSRVSSGRGLLLCLPAAHEHRHHAARKSDVFKRTPGASRHQIFAADSDRLLEVEHGERADVAGEQAAELLLAIGIDKGAGVGRANGGDALRSEALLDHQPGDERAEGVEVRLAGDAALLLGEGVRGVIGG